MKVSVKPPATVFFPFRNRQTYWFFLWITRNSPAWVEDLIASAVKDAERGNFDEDGPQYHDVAEILGYELKNRIDDYGKGLQTPDGQDEGEENLDNTAESLTRILVMDGLEQISTSDVTHAILRKYKNWSPDERIVHPK